MFTLLLLLLLVCYTTFFIPLLAFAALAPLERNLAFRSPSLTVGSSELAHDVNRIGHDIVRRTFVRRRDPIATLAALDGHAADQLFDMYDGNFGSDGQIAYKGKISFPFNVAAGDPEHDSIILWTNARPDDESTGQPVCVKYEVAKDNAFEQIVDTGYAWTTSDVDYAWKVESRGLRPLTKYAYRFHACHNRSFVSTVGQFKTLPTSNDVRVNKVKLALFSCSNLPFGYFHAYRQAALDKEVDLAVHVGDYLYEAIGDGSPNAYGDGRPLARVPLPNKEITTLDDYRQRYKSYRSDPDLQLLHSTKSWLHVWDDHEVADNAFNHGSADSNNTVAGTIDGVNFTDRKRNAVKAFFEWMPIRQVDTTDSLRIWRTFHYGRLAHLFMLATRQYDRDVTDVYYNTDIVAELSNDTNRSLMGGKQERWFYRKLIEAKKQNVVWKVVAQQIVVSHLHSGVAGSDIDYDAWDGYKANRRRMFDTLVTNKIDNTIFLAGDSHAAWAFDTVYEEWENSTKAYDARTGRGSIAVEFAGTSVTSPSGYGENLSATAFADEAKRLVRINRNLQFTDGAKRGYLTLSLFKSHALAEFWGFDDVTQRKQVQRRLAAVRVNVGENRLARPLNNGRTPYSGALQALTVPYETSKWNGTAFC